MNGPPTRPDAAGVRTTEFKAVAFDAFAIFDPRPITTLAETQFPGNGAALVNAWRIRQFEYTWLRVLAGRYSDFMHITNDALVFAAKAMKLDLPDDKRERLLGAFFELTPWPDVAPALKTLNDAKVRLALLSNFTPGMLDGCIKASRLEGLFDHVLSTDDGRTYKPDPRAYQLGVDALKLRRKEIVFAPFAGWDAAGAKSFGYPTFWVNRLGLPPEELGVLPDVNEADLSGLPAYIGS
jgi:2-haloacid dehalogenase